MSLHREDPEGGVGLPCAGPGETHIPRHHETGTEVILGVVCTSVPMAYIWVLGTAWGAVGGVAGVRAACFWEEPEDREAGGWYPLPRSAGRRSARGQPSEEDARSFLRNLLVLVIKCNFPYKQCTFSKDIVGGKRLRSEGESPTGTVPKGGCRQHVLPGSRVCACVCVCTGSLM